MSTNAIKVFDRNGVPQGLAITYRGHPVIENTLENSIHLGRRFFNRDWAAIGAGGSFNIFLELAMSSEGDYALHTDFEIESDQDGTLEMFIEPTVSDNGSELNVWNHNGAFQGVNVFHSNLYKDCTPTNDGTIIGRGRLSSGKKISSSRFSSGELILVEGRKVLIKIENVDTAGYIMWDVGFSQIYTGDIL